MQSASVHGNLAGARHCPDCGRAQIFPFPKKRDGSAWEGGTALGSWRDAVNEPEESLFPLRLRPSALAAALAVILCLLYFLFIGVRPAGDFTSVQSVAGLAPPAQVYLRRVPARPAVEVKRLNSLGQKEKALLFALALSVISQEPSVANHAVSRPAKGRRAERSS